MNAGEQHEAAEPEPRWLQGIERDAWLSLIGVIIRLPAAMDAQLQRDAGLSHFEYTVMVNLSNTDGMAPAARFQRLFPTPDIPQSPPPHRPAKSGSRPSVPLPF